MEEGTGKAILFRRSRAGTREAAEPRRWREEVAAGVRLAIEAPRQLWLAALGGAALTLRRARGAWSDLVAEGTSAEGWLRRTLRRE